VFQSVAAATGKERRPTTDVAHHNEIQKMNIIHVKTHKLYIIQKRSNSKVSFDPARPGVAPQLSVTHEYKSIFNNVVGYSETPRLFVVTFEYRKSLRVLRNL